MLKHCNVRGQYLLHCTTVLHILTYKGSFRLFEFWFCLLANIMIFVLPSAIWNHGCGIYHQWYPRGYLKPPLWDLPSVISSGIFAQVYLCDFPRMNPQPVVSACNSDTGCLLVVKDCVLLMLFIKIKHIGIKKVLQALKIIPLSVSQPSVHSLLVPRPQEFPGTAVHILLWPHFHLNQHLTISYFYWTEYLVLVSSI